MEGEMENRLPHPDWFWIISSCLVELHSEKKDCETDECVKEKRELEVA